MIDCLLDWLWCHIKPLFDEVLAVASLAGLIWYARDTNRMKREQLEQGIAARRPFLSIEFPAGMETANLVNYGPGNAFWVTWKFVEPMLAYPDLSSAPDPIGAMGVRQAAPLMCSVQLFPTHSQREAVRLVKLNAGQGIRVDYEDSSGKRYWSTITRAPEGHTYTDSSPA
jgi:hypothetical protein